VKLFFSSLMLFSGFDVLALERQHRECQGSGDSAPDEFPGGREKGSGDFCNKLGVSLSPAPDMRREPAL